jgi:hypothetical protein
MEITINKVELWLKLYLSESLSTDPVPIELSIFGGCCFDF